MDADMQNLPQTLLPNGIPHNVSDLVLTHVVRLATTRLHVETEYRHEDGFPEPNEADDSLVDVLRTCLMVAPDLPLVQQAAVFHHPDWDIVELCAEGDLTLVKAWFSSAIRGEAPVLDSLLLNCITAGSANGHVRVLDWLHRFSRCRMFYSTEAMDLASAAGHIEVLRWWLKSGLKLRYSAQAMDGASGNGETQVLDWWVSSELELKYTEDAIDLASADGYVACLQWWNDSGLECKYSEAALHEATAVGGIAVLNWWKDSGLKLKYEKSQILRRCTNYGRLDCFEWWINEAKLIASKGMPTYVNMFDKANCTLDEYWAALQWRLNNGFSVTNDMSKDLAGTAAKEGRVDVLQWWIGVKDDFRKSCGELLCHAAGAGQLAVIEWAVSRLHELDAKDWIKDCDRMINEASTNGHIHVLDWWKRSGIDLKYTHLAIDDACANGHLDVVKWWASSGLECRYTGRSVDKAAGRGHVAILKWLHEQPATAPIFFPEDYSGDAIDSASTNGHVSPLQFFVDTGLQLKHTHCAMNGASRWAHIHVLDWWLQHRDTLDLKWSQAAISPYSLTVPLLEWWRNSKLAISLDVDFGGMARMGHGPPEIIHWLKDKGYSVSLSPYALGNRVFEFVECAVDVVGIKPTRKLISQLLMQGQQDHIIEWLEERISDTLEP